MADDPGETFGTFDFGLTPAEEARAAKLHAESIVIDLLFQGPIGYRSYTDDMRKELDADWDAHHDPGRNYEMSQTLPIRKALAGEFDGFEAVWRASGITAGNRQAGVEPNEALTNYGITIAQFDGLPWLVKALRAADIRRAKAEGKVAGFVSTQNSEGVDSKMYVLRAAYEFGLRMMGLTYNTMNAAGSGCTERTDAGVSNFGAALIHKMNELGIIVDTAHSGRQTTLDCCTLSERPVVASHSCAEGVYRADRAKSDEELDAIAATGGVIGVVAVPFFLAPGEGVTIDAMLDHIDYIATRVGPEHVAIGSDWPLQSPKEILARALQPMAFDMGFRPEHNIDSVKNVVGFDDYRDFVNVTRGLVKRGYTDEQISGIIGGNFLRVFESVCG
jgi:membrane dipeptidase